MWKMRKISMGIDKHYQEMIDNILNGASDREQLEIILKLVEGLKGWNDKGDDYLTNLYYYNLEQIEQKIKVVLEKEDYYSAYKKAIRDYTELQEILSLYRKRFPVRSTVDNFDIIFNEQRFLDINHIIRHIRKCS